MRNGSSDKIDGPGSVDRTGNNFAKSHNLSFGVSRETMKKIYIDEILKKGTTEVEPGPDKYTLDSSFGPKVGERYSMRPKNDPFVLHLEKQKKLPGPGAYLSNYDMAGKVHLNSRLANQPKNAFSKAQDRFRTTGFSNPSPVNYSPKAGLNQNVKS